MQRHYTFSSSPRVLALIAAIWVSIANRPESEGSAKPTRCCFRICAIRSTMSIAITLTGAGNKALVTLKRGADGWHVAEKSQAIRRTLAKLREFLLKLADATVIEDEDVESRNATPTWASRTSPRQGRKRRAGRRSLALKQPVKLIIGLLQRRRRRRHVRAPRRRSAEPAGQGQSAGREDPAAWIKQDLANIDAERIKQVG